MESYLSIKNEAVVFLEEKKSKFIGSVFKIDTEEDAKEIIRDTRIKYIDATHNCYGFITLDGKIKRYSDDGEPSKTAGVPILDVIEKQNLRGVLIIVTRYYGGTLLGTGGLVKMYQSSAISALESAEVVLYEEYQIYTISIPYNLKAKIDNVFLKENFVIVSEEYTDSIQLSVQIKKDDSERLFKIISDMTNGSAYPVLKNDNIMCYN